jgi:hypothetical protein
VIFLWIRKEHTNFLRNSGKVFQHGNTNHNERRHWRVSVTAHGIHVARHLFELGLCVCVWGGGEGRGDAAYGMFIVEYVRAFVSDPRFGDCAFRFSLCRSRPRHVTAEVPKLFCPVDHLPIFSVCRKPLPRGRSKTSQAV